LGPGGAAKTLKGEQMFSKRVLWLLVLSSAATAVAARGQSPDPDPNRFAPEIEAFQDWDRKNAVPDEPILFVGSSSIRMWRTRESFPDLPVVNRGFGGSHISDILHFRECLVLRYKPQVIVFYAGDNDIAAGKSAERVCGDYRRFVQLVHARLPHVCLIFVAIKPSESRWSFWPEMQKANELVRDYCGQDERLFFADLATPLFGPDDRPDPELFLPDRLHLNARGYALWSRTLRPVLQQALAAPHARASAY
jgi:lysophospholipase L1-like esterase